MVITRNIRTQSVSVKVISLNDFSMKDISLIVPRNITEEKEQLSYVEKTMPGYKALAILSVTVTEQLFGMTEEDFMRYAKPIEMRSEVKSN